MAKDAAKDARVEAKAARLLNGSGLLALVLQVRGSVGIAGKEMRHCLHPQLQD